MSKLQSMSPNVLVTGSNGFVGAEVCRELRKRNISVTAVSRHSPVCKEISTDYFRQIELGDIASAIDWSGALQGIDVVVHLAARVHVMKDTVADPLAEFRRVNVTATESLARAAAEKGVKRFIYLSSIKVNGENTFDKPFCEDDLPHPQDPYGISKLEAEQILRRVSAETGMQIVILRCPLVYGPNVKANFLSMMQWVERGIPLPLAAVNNRRSMIYLGNLVDAIATCIDHPRVAGKTYLLSDGHDISTPELIRLIARAFGKPAQLWALPQQILRWVGVLIGKYSEVDRLLGSLQIDSSRFRSDTCWSPAFTMQQGIAQTVQWYQMVSKK